MKPLSVSLIFLIAISANAAITPWDEKVNAYVKGLPKDVVALLRRMESCQHYGGEEAYDQARKKQIEVAVKKLRCDQLDADKEKALKKHAKQPAVVEKINGFAAFLE